MWGSHRSSLAALLAFHACSDRTLLSLSFPFLSLPLSWRVAMLSVQFQICHEWLKGTQTDRAMKWDRLKCTPQISFPSDELPLCSVSKHAGYGWIIIWIKRLQLLLHLVASSTSVVSACSLLLRLLFAASVCKIRWQECLFPAVLFQPSQKVFVNWPVWHRAVVHHKEQVLDIINIWLAAHCKKPTPREK